MSCLYAESALLSCNDLQTPFSWFPLGATQCFCYNSLQASNYICMVLHLSNANFIFLSGFQEWHANRPQHSRSIDTFILHTLTIVRLVKRPTRYFHDAFLSWLQAQKAFLVLLCQTRYRRPYWSVNTENIVIPATAGVVESAGGLKMQWPQADLFQGNDD